MRPFYMINLHKIVFKLSLLACNLSASRRLTQYFKVIRGQRNYVILCVFVQHGVNSWNVEDSRKSVYTFHSKYLTTLLVIFYSICSFFQLSHIGECIGKWYCLLYCRFFPIEYIPHNKPHKYGVMKVTHCIYVTS